MLQPLSLQAQYGALWGQSMNCRYAKSRLALGVAAGALLTLVSATDSAIAQTAAPSAEDRKVEKVVVTARKRSEAVQDIPASVSVVGSEDAKNRNAQRVRDLQNVSPNVIFTGTENNSLTRITVRGIESQPRQNVGSEAGLGIYVDGVDGCRIEECLFDHNGWRPTVPGADATIYRHNIYIQGNNTDAMLRGNIIE